MESDKVSLSAYYFLVKVRQFLESIDSSFDDFFANFQLAKKGCLNKLEFFKITSLLNIQKQHNFDGQKTFAQLSQNQLTINISALYKLYMNLKEIRIGLYKLKEFMRHHKNPSQFLEAFDKDGKKSLNKNQFNSFLKATEIKELSQPQIRSLVIEQIFKYFLPKKEITLKQLLAFFKISEKAAHSFTNPNKGLYQPVQSVSKKINLEKVSCPKAMKNYRRGIPSTAELEYLQQLENLLNKNQKYLDIDNPAIETGVYMCATQIFKTENYDLFQMDSTVQTREVSRVGIARQIQPKDIIRGKLLDSYFLGSLSSIAYVYPEFIADKFLFNKNPANYYAIKLFIDGEWKIIKTDDRFPCNSNGSPLFAQPYVNKIWVMLYQKCWAKFFGNYKAIEIGSSKQAFTILTGAPSIIISLEKDKNQIQSIKHMQYQHGDKFIATASASNYLNSLESEVQQKLGLDSGIAYSLQRTININNETLVKLRNPCGSKVWKGRWSFSSQAWTQQLRVKHNYFQDPQDGSFYMSCKDFQIYLGEIIVCKMNPYFTHKSIRVNTDCNKSGYLLMKVKTPGRYILSIYQENKRKFSSSQNYSYSSSRIIILKRNNQQLKYIGAKSITSTQCCSFDMQKLEAGEYFVSVKVEWKLWKNHQMIVTSYGVDNVDFQLINREIAPQFKRKLIDSYSKQFSGTGKIKKYQKYGFDAYCETKFDIDTGIGFVRMVNSSQKSFQSIHQMKVKGIKVIKPDKLPLLFKMGPKSDKTYGFFIKAEGYQYSTTEKIIY